MPRAEQVVCLDEEMPLLAEVLDDSVQAWSVAQPDWLAGPSIRQSIASLGWLADVVEQSIKLVDRNT
jgi:hypothetical protein